MRPLSVAQGQVLANEWLGQGAFSALSPVAVPPSPRVLGEFHAQGNGVSTTRTKQFGLQRSLTFVFASSRCIAVTPLRLRVRLLPLGLAVRLVPCEEPCLHVRPAAHTFRLAPGNPLADDLSTRPDSTFLSAGTTTSPRSPTRSVDDLPATSRAQSRDRVRVRLEPMVLLPARVLRSARSRTTGAFLFETL